MVLYAIEHPLSNEFKQWVRSSEIKETICLAVSHKLGATLNEARAVVAEEWT